MVRSPATAGSLSVFLLISAQSSAQQDAVGFTNLSGGNHHLELASPLTDLARGLTVEAWITYDDATLGTGAPYRWPTICRHTVGGSQSYFLRVNAGQNANRVLRWTVRDATDTNRHANYTFSPGEFANWTHVAATHDGQTIRLYVNGNLVATGSAAGPLTIYGGPLQIGEGATHTTGGMQGSEGWHGSIDEFRLWPFARTVDEIRATMGEAVVAIPGGVTFNFDGGVPIDTSSGLTATVVGTVPFVPGAALPTRATGASAYGMPATTCAAQRVGASVGSATVAGNLAFALYGYDGPANASGGVLLSPTQQSPPVSFLGIEFLVGLGTLLPVVPSVSSGPMGTARLPLSLGPSTTLGLTLHAQFLFLDPCGAQGIVASQGLRFTVQ